MKMIKGGLLAKAQAVQSRPRKQKVYSFPQDQMAELCLAFFKEEVNLTQASAAMGYGSLFSATYALMVALRKLIADGKVKLSIT